ncbi:MAG: CoA-binding protein [Gammaproteobacteria bacterium]|nr:CoA-binding protein [Gammaproteobacteria bacterium]
MAAPLMMPLVISSKTIALVGASPKVHRASHRVMAYLIAQGYHVIPVNPLLAGSMILGCKVVAKLQDIEGRVDGINMFRRSEFIAQVYQDIMAMQVAPTWIWLQQDIMDNKVAEAAIARD